MKREIKEIFYQHKKRYGAPRIRETLRKQGVPCSQKRVARLMKEMEIRAEGKKPFKVTTNSNHNHPVAPNLLGRYFEASEPN